ncbi:ribonuclease E (chloroplast) [Guillardia theta]|uniref:Ribonuclease E/G-like protein n=2 Tax=Guillardia theta TaxID=55529 RepID=RNE_GUITH|nr:ribonuclease E [Guillardia theta]O78453.1 RecName: Full=Ribonuclease E/G-like protein; Short=RNase E/G-like protein [Guillardia theta]AAC35644.1 ribonuclease E [Guillardia theta]
MSFNIIILKELGFSLVFSQSKCEYIIFQKEQCGLNDIYFGFIPRQSIYPTLNAAFVTLDSERNQGFIPFTLLIKKSNQQFVIPNSVFLIQVIKEPTINKPATLTSHIFLNSFNLNLQFSGIDCKYLNLYPNIKFLHICLITLLIPSGLDINFDHSMKDILYLDLIGQSKILYYSFSNLFTKLLRIKKMPQFIFRNSNFFLPILNKLSLSSINDFFVSSYQRAVYLRHFLITHYFTIKQTDYRILFYPTAYKSMQLYYLDMLFYRSLKPIVYTLYGIFIVICKTEALISIDVNSGSHSSRVSQNLSLHTNLIASKSIIKEIKLRNLAGVIVIDFVDMIHQKDQIHLLAFFRYLLNINSVMITLIQLSDIGLLELTRKRQDQSIYDVFQIGNISKSSFLYDRILSLNKNLFKTNLLINYTLFSNVKLIYNY